MKYMLLMYTDPAESEAMSASELDTVVKKHEALRTELTSSGELLNGAGVTSPETTKTLRLGAGAVADGPVNESGENMSAYYVVDCESLERALSIAEGLLDFHVKAVEVRQIHDSAGMGD